ncbi:MAG TPA: hypothetical protein VNN10_12700, partial [Dehalococcoidia bacterium]|nr:hypothetical protein [Dehalococcoidia bacterium]
GADVYSSDGHKLGELHRVVLKRSDLSVTHIVVDIGFLRSGRPIWEGGVGLDYDRVVPISAVASVGDDRIVLNMTAEEFKDAPEYTIESFEPPEDLTPGEFDITDIVDAAHRIADYVGSVGANYWLFEKLNKPAGSVDIAEGTPVWRQEPHQKLGEVSRVLVGADGVAQALVIRRGFLLKRDVILPLRYVTELMDDLVRVDISDEHLEALKEYEGP